MISHPLFLISRDSLTKLRPKLLTLSLDNLREFSFSSSGIGDSHKTIHGRKINRKWWPYRNMSRSFTFMKSGISEESLIGRRKYNLKGSLRDVFKTSNESRCVRAYGYSSKFWVFVSKMKKVLFAVEERVLIDRDTHLPNHDSWIPSSLYKQNAISIITFDIYASVYLTSSSEVASSSLVLGAMCSIIFG